MPQFVFVELVQSRSHRRGPVDERRGFESEGSQAIPSEGEPGHRRKLGISGRRGAGTQGVWEDWHRRRIAVRSSRTDHGCLPLERRGDVNHCWVSGVGSSVDPGRRTFALVTAFRQARPGRGNKPASGSEVAVLRTTNCRSTWSISVARRTRAGRTPQQKLRNNGAALVDRLGGSSFTERFSEISASSHGIDKPSARRIIQPPRAVWLMCSLKSISG